MGQAAINVGAVFVGAYLTYLLALLTWRRQQRREVYGRFVAALSDMLELLDLLLIDQPDTRRLGSHPEWDNLHRATRELRAAEAQVRLLAPKRVSDVARRMWLDLQVVIFLDNETTVADLGGHRAGAQHATWPGLTEFIALARRDLTVRR